jgi:hypothetical protein
MEDSKQSINRIYVYLIKQDTTQVKLIPNWNNILVRKKERKKKKKE